MSERAKRAPGAPCATTTAARLRRRVRRHLELSGTGHVLGLLAVAQTLDSLDRGSLGAMAPSLESSLQFSNTGLGVLMAIVSASSAVATLGAGVLVDRRSRTRLLAWSLGLWTVAMAAGALAPSFGWLLLSRVALGVVIATVGPATASLIGDLVPDDRRGAALGWVRSGELFGIGAAFLVVSSVTWALSWRVVFVVLAVVGGVVARQFARTPEPARTASDTSDRAGHRRVEQIVDEAGVEPGPDGVMVTPEAAGEMSLLGVVRYALAIRTNRMLLIAEALGDAAFSGIGAFAVLYATKQYRISQSVAAGLLPVAGCGAVAGVVAGGWFGDWLIRSRRILPGRLWVAGAGYLLTAMAVVPALAVRSVATALPFLTVAAAGLGAAGPTVSAARLDVVVGVLWGRVEAVRTMLRTLVVAAAPLAGGAVSDRVRGGGREGLQVTIALGLPLLAVNGLLVLVASRSYASDVAASAASTTANASSATGGPVER
jgi:sugar phosphate permease